MRDGIVNIALIGHATGKGDVLGGPVAMNLGKDVLSGSGRFQVVDAQIQGGGFRQATLNGHDAHAAEAVQKHGHHTAMDHAGFGIADEFRPVGDFAQRAGFVHCQQFQPHGRHMGNELPHQLPHVFKVIFHLPRQWWLARRLSIQFGLRARRG